MAGIVSGSFIPIALSSVTGIQNGQIRIKMVYWYNPANIGDLVSLQDEKGNVIWPGRCETANQSQVVVFPREIVVNGYQAPILGSGTLYIYYV